MKAVSPAAIRAWFVFLAVAGLALLLGLVLAVQPTIGARVGAVVVMGALLFIAVLMPDSQRSTRPLAICFNIFAAVTILWPRYAVFKRGGLPAISPDKIAFFALIALWLWTILGSSDVRAGLWHRMRPLKPALWLIGLLAAWRVITSFTGDAPVFLPLKSALNEVVSFYLMLLIALTVWREPKDMRAFLFVILSSTLIVCLLGIYEGKVSRNLFGQFVDTDGDLTGRLAETLREKFRAGKYRVQSTFEHPLVLAEFLVIVVPIAVYLVVSVRHWAKRLIVFLTIPLMAYIVYKTDSRSAMSIVAVSMAGALFLFALRSYRVDRSIVGAVIGLLVPALLATAPLLVSLVAGIVSGDLVAGSATTSARVFMLNRGLPLVWDNPVLGFGVSQGGEKVGYVLSSGLFSIDNYYLTLALDSGVLAFFLYFSMLCFLAWRLILAILDRQAADGAMAVCMLLVLVGFAGMRAILTIPTNHWLFFSLMASVSLLDTSRRRTGSQEARRLR